MPFPVHLKSPTTLFALPLLHPTNSPIHNEQPIQLRLRKVHIAGLTNHSQRRGVLYRRSVLLIYPHRPTTTISPSTFYQPACVFVSSTRRYSYRRAAIHLSISNRPPLARKAQGLIYALKAGFEAHSNTYGGSGLSPILFTHNVDRRNGRMYPALLVSIILFAPCIQPPSHTYTSQHYYIT